VAVTGDAEITHFAGRSGKVARPATLVGAASNVARDLAQRHGRMHAVVGSSGCDSDCGRAASSTASLTT